MNYKFKKKPIIIEAFQMTKKRRWDNKDWPIWLSQAWNKESPSEGAMWCIDLPENKPKERLVIGTMEGVFYISWGDWIIRGIKGELYCCKPNIFEATYEEVQAIKL